MIYSLDCAHCLWRFRMIQMWYTCSVPILDWGTHSFSFQKGWLLKDHNCDSFWELPSAKGSSLALCSEVAWVKRWIHAGTQKCSSLPQFVATLKGHLNSRAPSGISWGLCHSGITVQLLPWPKPTTPTSLLNVLKFIPQWIYCMQISVSDSEGVSRKPDLLQQTTLVLSY